ncbi:hypothetical protein, partial [Halolamina salina]
MAEDGTPDGRPVLGTLLDPAGDTQARELSFALAREAGTPVRLLAPQRAPDAQTAPVPATSADGPPVQ